MGVAKGRGRGEAHAVCVRRGGVVEERVEEEGGGETGLGGGEVEEARGELNNSASGLSTGGLDLH